MTALQLKQLIVPSIKILIMAVQILFDASIAEVTHLHSRSRLYCLMTERVGTCLVESITSYLTRLAQEHSLPVGVLMEREISPVINRKYGGGHLNRIYEATAALNGTGVMALSLVNALEKLTKCKNLHFLTLLSWAELLPHRNLLRPHRAWCSKCYEEWKQAGKNIIEPLLWTMEVVKICPDHYQLLNQVCPHCHQKNLPLAWKSRPGYCSKCMKWLGSKRMFGNTERVSKSSSQSA